jgi:predicted transcriptional regulator
MKLPRPSDLEMQVLTVLWTKGEATVRDVLEALPDGKKRAYTTVLSVIQVMEKKGLIQRTRADGLAQVYRSVYTRSQVCRPLVKDLLRHVFGGRASTAVQYLLAEGEVDAAEVKAIRKLLDAHGGGGARGDHADHAGDADTNHTNSAGRARRARGGKREAS